MTPWWQRLARYARPEKFGVAAVLLLLFIGVGLDVAKPWPLKLLVDCVLNGAALPAGADWLAGLPHSDTRGGMLAWLAAGTVVLFVASQLIRVAQQYIQTGVGNRMVYELGADLFDHLQKLSLRYHSRQSTGDLVRRVTNSTGCVRDLMFWVAVPTVTAVASLAAMTVVMMRLNWVLALVALSAALPLAWLIRRCERSLSQRAEQQQQLEGAVMALAEQTLTALPVVQVYGREDFQERRYRRLTHRAVAASVRVTQSQLRFEIGTGFVTAAGTAVLMFLGGALVVMNLLTVGDLLVFLSYLASLYAPLETLGYLAQGFATAAAGARRVFEVLDVADTVRDAPHARPLAGKTRGAVCWESVTFGYEPDRPVLRELSLAAQPGETIALVGPTGAGKSTVVALLPRFFDPWSGRVLLDGADLRELRVADLREQIAIVLQEPFLLPLKVADNIAYGRPDARRAAIEAAALSANADEFIRRLPRGYDTVIGERGATLSGGERQRLAIARAFLKDAPVLILDEPTAALDTLTEARLLEALTRLTAGRTTFIIAHRLSTIRRANRVAVLDGGRIVECGSPDELLAAGGAFQRLHDLQFGASAERKGLASGPDAATILPR